MMKALTYTNYGPPEVVSVAQVAKPIPADDEILIKVYSSTVNRTDCGFRSAEYFISRIFSGLLKPKNQILGSEFAGKIENVGKNVSKFKIGDRLFGFNDSKFGAHAEYMTLKETDAIALIPENLSYQDAAPISEGAHYALNDIRAAKVSNGQDVLVNGATGAIGSAAVQLIKYLGANVTAVCDTKNIDLVKSIGADEVIDYKKEDFTKMNKKFDFIFDAVGKSSFGLCKPLLKENGIYISTELGEMSQNPFLAMITPFIGGKKVMFPIPNVKQEDIQFLKELVENGKYKPLIDRKYPMEDAVEAYKYVETGQKIGNVVLIIDNDAE